MSPSDLPLTIGYPLSALFLDLPDYRHIQREIRFHIADREKMNIYTLFYRKSVRETSQYQSYKYRLLKPEKAAINECLEYLQKNHKEVRYFWFTTHVHHISYQEFVKLSDKEKSLVR